MDTEEEAKKAKKVDPPEPDADDMPMKKGQKMPWDPKEPDADDKPKKKKARADDERLQNQLSDARDITHLR